MEPKAADSNLGARTPPPGTSQTQSSPVKQARKAIDESDREQWSKHVYFIKGVNEEISVANMVTKLCDTKNEAWFQKWRKVKIPSHSTKVVEELNEWSAQMAKDDDYSFKLVFMVCGNNAPKEHPTGTACRTDLVAYSNEQPRTRQTIKWSEIWGTGEIHSTGKSYEDSYAQAAAYSKYHLQACPNMVSVPGLWMKDTDLKIFLTSADKIYHCHPTKDQDKRRLMSAYMWRLYNPFVDPTVVPATDSTPKTFTVTKPNTYHNLRLSCVGDAIGRRTVIFTQADPASTIVIKEQYINPKRRFKEGELLDKIHAGRDFPGVVRYESFGPVEHDGVVIKASENRVKYRLVLKDKGRAFEEIGTFREMLKLSYDLLEVLRILHRKKHILHRDLSPGNILFREMTKPTLKEGDESMDDMCFIDCLLDAKADFQPSLEDRLTTTLLLADFDSGEVKAERPTVERIPRTGTSAFMAVAVRGETNRLKIGVLPPIPEVDDRIKSRYTTLLPKRLEKFWDIGEEVHMSKAGRFARTSMVTPNTSEDKFEHLLRHDAESVFWCMLWWSILAHPGTFSEFIHLSDNDWDNFTSVKDARYKSFITSEDPLPVHEDYGDIGLLLGEMRRHLWIDLQHSENEIRRDNAEYLCEVFQRLILNFLVENRSEPFLDLEKHKVPRMPQVKDVTGTTTGSKKSLKRTHEESNRGDATSNVDNDTNNPVLPNHKKQRNESSKVHDE